MRTLESCTVALVTGLALTSCQDNRDRVEVPTGPSPAREGAVHGREISGQRPLGGPAVGLQLVAERLTSPVGLRQVPDGTGRLFVADQAGLIRIIMPDGTLLTEPFLDLRERMVTLISDFDERGLLGLAFHPQYATNGRFFVYYSAPLRPDGPAGFNHTSHISEFEVSMDPDLAEPGSERILLQVDQPQFNHNAGALAFGPQDGFLYIALGDGGRADDTGLGHVDDWYEVNEGGNAQNIAANLLGKILRIDVDMGVPYAIPADNPFVGEAGRDEIWAYGLRNPWRMSFDMGGDHMLLAGDAGQVLWEEVNVIVRRGNYGWNVKEGLICFNTDDNTTPRPDCPDVDPTTGEPPRDPVINYANIFQPRGIGTVVVGGYVYRGSALPQFRGQYIFGDWSTSFVEPDGSVLLAQPRARGLWHMQELQFPHRPNRRLGHYVLAFGQDRAGEVYVLTTDNTGPFGDTGRIYKLLRHSGRP